jgi:hypothetical protein
VYESPRDSFIVGNLATRVYRPDYAHHHLSFFAIVTLTSAASCRIISQSGDYLVNRELDILTTARRKRADNWPTCLSRTKPSKSQALMQHRIRILHSVARTARVLAQDFAISCFNRQQLARSRAMSLRFCLISSCYACPCR